MNKVLFVVPGKKSKYHEMIFVRRQIESLESLVEGNVYFLENRLNPVRLFKSFFEIRRCLEESNADIIHAQYGTVTAFVAAFFLKKKLVMSLRGSDINPNLREHRLRKIMGVFLTHLASLRVSKILSVSPELAQKVIFTSEIEIIPSGIDTEKFSPTPMTDAREKLGLSIDKKYVFFNSGNAPLRKRLDLAQKLFDKLKARSGLDLEFIVMKGQIHPDDVPMYMSASDLLFVTSEQEGSPNIVKEALSIGLPVLAFESGDVRQMLKRDPVSRCFAWGEDETFVGYAHELLKSGKRGKGRENLQDISLPEIAKRISKIYDEIITKS